AAGIPTWSPTVVLICRSTAYVWQSGRDAQFSADCGPTMPFRRGVLRDERAALPMNDLATSALGATGTVDFAIRKQVRPQLSSRVSRRDAFDTSVFTDDGSAYYLNISVGTPAQLQTIELDTGSSDLFVTDSTAPFCRNNTCAGGTFDASKSSTYSIFLSNLGQYGSIIFGGVDTQKFQGNLVTLNCFPSGKNVKDFNLYMPNVTMVDGNGTVTQIVGKNNTQYGFFDSGASAWYVAETVFNRIIDLTEFVYSPDLGLAIRTCADISNTIAFDFHFGGWRGVTGVPYTDPSGKQYCALEVLPAKSSFNGVWGDSIMRAGYFVYDLDNGQVSIGQARYSDQSNIVAVQAGPHGLANAINQPQYAQTAQTYPPAPFATALSREASVYTTNNTVGVATASTAIDSGSLGSSSLAYTNSTSRTTYTSISSAGSSNLKYSDSSAAPSSMPSWAPTSESISTTDSWYSSATPSVDEVAFLKAQVAELQAKLDSCGCHY
ncbi:hypothetical protein KCU91_g15264, partial [Aureobasidium melanogenum]